MNSSTLAADTAAGSLTGKYLTVELANEKYGIPILKVREIIRLQKITPIPEMPACVKGVIDLRGRVVVIVDLRLKFGLADAFTERTCIVVVHVQVPSGATVPVGLIVDGVEEVVTLNAAQIEPTPDFGSGIATEYFLGMAKVNSTVQTLLNIDKVVGSEAVQGARL